MATYSYNGVYVYPDPFIIPKRPLALPNGTFKIFAKEIGKSGPFFGVVENDYTGNGTIGYLVVEQIVKVKKITVGTGNAITNGDALSLVANPTATANDYWVRKAQSADPIHGHALEDAAAGVTEVLMKGPYRPPYAAQP